MAFQTNDGSIALELVTATLASMHLRGKIDLGDVESALRAKAKSAEGAELADIDGALEVLDALRDRG